MGHQFKQRPYFGGKIGGSGGGFRRVPVKIDTPDCALVAGERSDPVTSVTLAQHRLAIWKKKLGLRVGYKTLATASG